MSEICPFCRHSMPTGATVCGSCQAFKLEDLNTIGAVLLAVPYLAVFVGSMIGLGWACWTLATPFYVGIPLTFVGPTLVCKLLVKPIERALMKVFGRVEWRRNF